MIKCVSVSKASPPFVMRRVERKATPFGSAMSKTYTESVKYIAWQLKFYEARERKGQKGVWSWRLSLRGTVMLNRSREPPPELIELAERIAAEKGLPFLIDVRNGHRANISPVELLAMAGRKDG